MSRAKRRRISLQKKKLTMSASQLVLGNLFGFSVFAKTIVSKPYFAISIRAMEAPQDYPKPITDPPPPISKDIELRRATEASSKSSLFNLTRDHVLYEDQWLMAVNKPKGVYCEALLSSAHHVVADSSTIANEFHLANRLDRDTSGVMLITKSHKVAAKLVKAFTEHKVRKSYIALCIGSSPSWNKITITSGHGRSKHGAWRVYAASDVGRVLPGGSVVRHMETTFEVVSVNGEKTQPSTETMIVVEGKPEFSCKGEDVVVLRAFPQSGRTHQIRLHCQYLGIPIRGDVKYYGTYEWRGTTFEGHELHAEVLSLNHPITDDPIVIQAPLPSWAAGVVDG